MKWMYRPGPWLAMLLVGVLAISIPPLIESGLGGTTLRAISMTAGVGLVASALVLALTGRYGSSRHVDSLDELVHLVGRRPVIASPRLAGELADLRKYAIGLRELGVERVFRTRADAYQAIADEMAKATRIHVLSGCMQTFWGIHRQVLLDRDRVEGTEVVVLLMHPESPHLASRTAMDERFAPDRSRQMLAGFSAASRQIASQLRECYLYDYCSPASVWLVDDSVYVTPRFYATPGGHGFCVKLVRVPGGLYDAVRTTVEAAIGDARKGIQAAAGASTTPSARARAAGGP